MTVERVRAYGLVAMRNDARTGVNSGGPAAPAVSNLPLGAVAAAVPVYQRDGFAAATPPAVFAPAVTFYPGVPANWSPGLWQELREVLRQLEERDRLLQRPPALPAQPPASAAPPAPPKPAAPPVPPRPEPPKPEPQAEKPAAPGGTYTVKGGDSLSAIARRTLGDANRWRELYELNRGVIGPNPDLIHPGQVLRLPGGAHAPAPAPAPAPQPGPPGGPARHGNVPYISQYSPAGRENGYTNGNANCGPTSMAMAARAIGYRKDLSDAKLINHLGSIGKTTGNGTNVNGIAVMARAMGMSAQTRGPGANVSWIVQQLRAGKFVVANGDYFAMKPHEDPGRSSGHYVLLTGIDGNGRILVRDPADSRVHSVSEAELKHFISSNPNGGYQIAVG